MIYSKNNLRTILNGNLTCTIQPTRKVPKINHYEPINSFKLDPPSIGNILCCVFFAMSVCISFLDQFISAKFIHSKA